MCKHITVDIESMNIDRSVCIYTYTHINDAQILDMDINASYVFICAYMYMYVVHSCKCVKGHACVGHLPFNKVLQL